MTHEEIEEMLRNVTPGPWTVDGPPWNQVIWSSAENRVAFMAHSNGLDDDRDLANARFIAWAREAVPALRAALNDAQAERDELERDLSDMRDNAESAFRRGYHAGRSGE